MHQSKSYIWNLLNSIVLHYYQHFNIMHFPHRANRACECRCGAAWPRHPASEWGHTERSPDVGSVHACWVLVLGQQGSWEGMHSHLAILWSYWKMSWKSAAFAGHRLPRISIEDLWYTWTKCMYIKQKLSATCSYDSYSILVKVQYKLNEFWLMEDFMNIDPIYPFDANE